MELLIRMKLDGAAFEDAGTEEVSRLLESIASRLPDPLVMTNGALNLHDVNGNHCGTCDIVSEAESKRFDAADDLYHAARTMRMLGAKSTRADCDKACNALDAAIKKAQ